MRLNQHSHLTYCTNIHPGESWEAIFNSLKQHLPKIKSETAPNQPFGLGLRLSHQSAVELLKDDELEKFKIWLEQNQIYVFTMNGFPYGEFHGTVVKDQVHQPDWTTTKRVQYTINLIKILANILPEGIDGGISTSPLSYKYWFDDQERIMATKKACSNLIKIVAYLVDIEKTTGKYIHIDIEPEPDGFLENTSEVIHFFNDHLRQTGAEELAETLKISKEQAILYINKHLQICYDVCHFALAFETPSSVIESFQKHLIKIGKIQISAALKTNRKTDLSHQKVLLEQFDEPTYLHQATVLFNNGKLKNFRDLSMALPSIDEYDFEELRTHFHVPIFVDQYEVLSSTQDDIKKALQIWKNNPYTNHLEIETYTWEVLPKNLQIDINQSITREILWVNEALKTT